MRVRGNCSIIPPGLFEPAAADRGPMVVHHRLSDALHVGRAALLSLGNGQVVRAPIGSVTGGGGRVWEGGREAVALRACEGTQSHGRKRVRRPAVDGSLGRHATFWLLDFVTARAAGTCDSLARPLRREGGHRA